MGLHRAEVVQYMRPGCWFRPGGLSFRLCVQGFHARAGSAPIVRFVLGMLAMIGALVFLGRPWRVMLRLAGGDGNAILGILGLIVGIGVGALFFKSGYNLGRSQGTYPSVGCSAPVMLGLLILLIMFPKFRVRRRAAFCFTVSKGRGRCMPRCVFLVAGLAVGVVAQRSRFCTMGLFGTFLFRQVFSCGVVALMVAGFVESTAGPVSSGLCGPAGGAHHGAVEFSAVWWWRAGLCTGGRLSGPPAVYGRRRGWGRRGFCPGHGWRGGCVAQLRLGQFCRRGGSVRHCCGDYRAYGAVFIGFTMRQKA